MKNSPEDKLLLTAVPVGHRVCPFQSGRLEASDVIAHSNLATSLKENTCNCQTGVCACPRVLEEMISPATDPKSVHHAILSYGSLTASFTSLHSQL